MSFSPYRRWGKRAFDILVSVLAGVGLLPVIAVTACVLRCSLGGSPMFRQLRGGKDGVPFEVVKFRTMLDTRDSDGHLLPDEERLTRAGALVRKLSLDELPQLWNVMRGHMSLVGPRPLLVEYLPRYSPEQSRRHEVLPGITGWAQINGRNNLSWEPRFELDVWYVDNVSFSLDLRILVLTLLTAIRTTDVNATGHATMPKFMGTGRADGEEARYKDPV
jgi:lipopolysaccharide/colanic/teichoic acid biosynthesis glycosyltransferase